MATRQEILNWCTQTLQTHLYRDYGPNGLQVEGKNDIHKVITAVTASKAAIDFAVEQGADMLLVHHGMFWKSEPLTITGWKKERIATLLKYEINMVGYHLPLDGHAELGNNAQLAKLLDLELESQCGEQNLINIGRLKTPQTLAQFSNSISEKLNREPVVVGNPDKTIQSVAWCTGGAQGFFQTAIDCGVDAYITGEISEPQFHLANETGTAFISAGHHATERYGIQALGEALSNAFDVAVCYFDEANPV